MVGISIATTGVALAALAALCLATQAVFIRVGTDDGNVAHALATVLGINIVVIVGGSLIAYYPDYGVTTLSFAVFAGAGLSGTVLARSLYFVSIERIGASRTEPIKASQPLHASLVAVLILGETLGPLHLLGIILIVVGIAAISWETSQTAPDRKAQDPYELLLPLGAAFFFGIEPTFVKIGFAEGTPVFVGLAIKTLAAGVGFFVFLWWRNSLPTRTDLQSGNGRLYLGAGVVSTVFLVVYFLALEAAPVVIVVPLVQSSPLLVLVFSYLFLGRLEHVTWRLTTAATVAVLGAVTVTVFG